MLRLKLHFHGCSFSFLAPDSDDPPVHIGNLFYEREPYPEGIFSSRLIFLIEPVKYLVDIFSCDADPRVLYRHAFLVDSDGYGAIFTIIFYGVTKEIAEEHLGILPVRLNQERLLGDDF